MAMVALTSKSLLGKRWLVLKKLAEGGFGAVYEAHDQKTGKRVAVKCESVSQPNPVLKIEVAVLAKLRGKTEHVCGFEGSGISRRGFNYVVMTLIGQSLDDLRRSRPKRRFSETTTLRLAIQCLKGLEELHGIGFVHRDVKPANFAMGRGNTMRVVFLLDFGLARSFRIPDASGKMVNRPPRDSCGFRGTVRYASSNAHDGLDLGRHDDLWSLYYVLIEFQRGRLPWHDLSDDIDVARMKRRVNMSELIGNMENEFRLIHDKLKKLRYDQKPKYEWFYEQFKAVQERKKLATRGAFEWEEAKSKK